LIEFTGERVIPGQVEPDLWNEHLARYLFAARLARGRVLDAGSGSGYGARELARLAARVTALDLSAEAAAWAHCNYQAPHTDFLAGSCTALPFREDSFDAVVAFEVIEHLRDQQAFLAECKRVLAPSGLLIVSTPNILYYAETRKQAGPNPFHQHEFEAAEFRRFLQGAFANVALLLQNRSECFAFYPPEGWRGGETLAEPGSDRPEDANFFIALCSDGPLPDIAPFIFVPRLANVLREREHHIALLESQVREARAERDAALEQLRALTIDLENSNRWARRLDEDLLAARSRITALQDELAAAQRSAQEKIDELEAENNIKTAWAQRLDAEVEDLRRQIATVAASRWVRAGRKVGLGPDIPALGKPAR
jgi:SAM-dependent methyltransferase